MCDIFIANSLKVETHKIFMTNEFDGKKINQPNCKFSMPVHEGDYVKNLVFLLFCSFVCVCGFFQISITPAF